MLSKDEKLQNPHTTYKIVQAKGGNVDISRKFNFV